MKKYILILLMLLISATVNAEDLLKFVPALTDVPVSKKVELYKDSIVEFDSAWGSVIEIEGECACSCKELNDYYDFIMPNLGWEESPAKDSDKLYKRESLTLRINLSNTRTGCLISFSENH